MKRSNIVKQFRFGVGIAALCALSAPLLAVVDSKPEIGEKSASGGKMVKTASNMVISSPDGVRRPPFAFSAEDDRFLNDVQERAFWFMWDACDPATGLTRDRTSQKFSSVAAVGFALGALPIGVERGWVTREEGQKRAEVILSALARSPRKYGLYYHFLDGSTAQVPDTAPEDVISTIDSALLLSGVIVSSSYFGGEVARVGDRLVEEANWAAFTDHKAEKEHWRGYVSLGWKPAKIKEPEGKGKLLPYYWIDAGDEQRLVTFLAVAAPKKEHAVDGKYYYGLRRAIGTDPAAGEFSYFPWSGALFTNFFAHCFIDYAKIGVDDPAANGVDRRARIDWWENSRRAVQMHKRKAKDNPKKFATFGEHAWGLTASDCPGGYCVPGLFPTHLKLEDERADLDVESYQGAGKDDAGDGTIAPYGAGCAVMFDPDASIAAMRYFHSLKDRDGKPLIWREKRPKSIDQIGEGEGYGFLDAYNLDKGWVAKDYLGIDQGPLVLAIENARTGLVWRLFHAHPVVKSGVARLKLPYAPRDKAP